MSALESNQWDAWFVAAAPTHAQAKKIFWRDLKALAPKECLSYTLDGELTLQFKHGPRITVLGLDVPERIEGPALDGIILDEFANMKEEVWAEHVRPALSTSDRPPGWGWFIGVPEGRNHYYQLCKEAERKDRPDWASFNWPSSDIIESAEIAVARNEMDPLIYSQEYEGSFVSFMGRAYHQFDRDIHAIHRLHYDPTLPLIFCFDFNVSPGVAVVLQEQELDGKAITAVIGEVHIPKGSNTIRVCRKLKDDWKHHSGKVLCYGDSSGGNRVTSGIAGSDWDLIRGELSRRWENVSVRVPKKNPPVRSRVNAVNARLKSHNEELHMLVDPENAPKTVEDLDGVVVIEGTGGEIDKSEKYKDITHLSDALGYYIHRKHPMRPRLVTSRAV